MTYSTLLLQFLAIPIIALACLILWDRRRRRERAVAARGWSPFVVVLILMIVATLYTIPWDDHLIATGVWWYKPALVSGVTLGHIPIEEALFFPLETLFVSLWFLWLAPYVARNGGTDREASEQRREQVGGRARSAGATSRARLGAALAGGMVWLIAVAILLVGWRPGAYAGWELAWALPPLILQVMWGGDILWRYRGLLAAVAIPAILYLSAVDALAIQQGIWTIDPHQSLAVLLGGLLPLEELLFFSLTTLLVTFGLALGVAAESRYRISAFQTWLAVSVGSR